MNLKNVVLLSSASGLSAIGCGYLISPQLMCSLYGIGLESVDEFNMVRSAYGSQFLGFAVLFLLGAADPRLSKPAFVALVTFMASFASGRIMSAIVDGKPGMLVIVHIVLEIFYAAAAVYFLLQERATTDKEQEKV
jgi:hypothetical protein